jgi:hypothetical protein
MTMPKLNFGGTNPSVFGVAFWRNEPETAFRQNEPEISNEARRLRATPHRRRRTIRSPSDVVEGFDPVVIWALCIRLLVRVGAREPVLRHVEPAKAVGQTGCLPRLTKTFETLTAEALGV